MDNHRGWRGEETRTGQVGKKKSRDVFSLEKEKEREDFASVRNLPVTRVRAQRQAKALASTSRMWRALLNSRILWSQSPKLRWHCSNASTTPLQNVSLVSSGFVRYANRRTNSSRLADWKSNSYGERKNRENSVLDGILYQVYVYNIYIRLIFRETFASGNRNTKKLFREKAERGKKRKRKKLFSRVELAQQLDNRPIGYTSIRHVVGSSGLTF